jgi:hypothetical protein
MKCPKPKASAGNPLTSTTGRLPSRAAKFKLTHYQALGPWGTTFVVTSCLLLIVEAWGAYAGLRWLRAST